MRVSRFVIAGLLTACCSTFAQNQPAAQTVTPAQSTAAQPAAPHYKIQDASSSDAPVTLDQVVDQIVDREHQMVKNLENYSPVVETYIQFMKPDPVLGIVPQRDQYFLRRLDLMSDGEKTYLGRSGMFHRFVRAMSRTTSMELNPSGFSWMVYADRDDFDRQHYDFHYVRREFLGDLRCVVLDVQPKKSAGGGRFQGRIWAEDQGYNIVRLNGTYVNPGHTKYYFHFDSWRLNLQPGVWLPSYVYSEEDDLHFGIRQQVTFKAQTRLWGYDLKHGSHESEMTQLVVDAPGVEDQSAAAQDATPVQSQRLWEQQAETNVVEKLQQAGLLAPPGEVDQVLETVVNNLEITNNVDLPWPVHCRVLLTSPLETFHVGHTIVVSRGLLDVLPDEASLAMVLSHELGHIVLGQQVDSKFGFSDRMIFSDEATYQRFGFSHSAQEEQAADKKAEELLQNSPYKGKLATAGLFLKALQARSSGLQALLTPHLGNPLAEHDRMLRMTNLMNSAPQLEMGKVDQIPALPLGGRVRVNPWSDQAELVKSPAVPLASAREKMLFEVTPVFPHVGIMSGDTGVAQNAPKHDVAPAAGANPQN